MTAHRRLRDVTGTRLWVGDRLKEVEVKVDGEARGVGRGGVSCAVEGTWGSELLKGKDQYQGWDARGGTPGAGRLEK